MASLASGGISTTTVDKDKEKYLVAKLLSNVEQNLVAKSICDKEPKKEGTGLTAYFVRYKRMYVPVVSITEGTDPSNNTFTLEEVTVTPDQWGDWLVLTDISELTAKHPLMERAMMLLGDNAQRVIDREVQIVWAAGTNVQYGDGSVTSRATVTSAMKVSDTVISKCRVTMKNNGAAPHGGPVQEQSVQSAASQTTINKGRKYVAVCSPEVESDIIASTNFISVSQYNDAQKIYGAEVGEYLGFRWCVTNFIAKYVILGNTTEAVVSTGTAGITGMVITALDAPSGGALKSSTTFFYKITRKDLLRGFEEAISIAHSTATTATGDNEGMRFAFPSTAGYVYNLYFDKTAAGGTSADSNLGLVQANIAAGTTVDVLTVATSTTTAPANIKNDGSVSAIHPVYVFGAEAVGWVGLQELEVVVGSKEATTDNPLKLRRTVGYKFMHKAVIKNQSFMMRIEVASAF